MADIEKDAELKAMATVVAALADLDADARARVIDYVFKRLGVSSVRMPAAGTLPAAEVSRGPDYPSRPATPLADVRALTQEKKPRSATEMAAVLAYYLSEVAPPRERKEEIDANDVKKYFKQANFPLPGSPKMTLVHAKNAGYLDPGSSRGRYRLNPVGYNLVAHNLPERHATRTRPERKRRKGATKPTSRKARARSNRS